MFSSTVLSAGSPPCSCTVLGIRLPPAWRGFQRPEIPKRLSYSHRPFTAYDQPGSAARPAAPVLHAATSWAAVRRLSYPPTCRGCPWQCRATDPSAVALAASRTALTPTSVAQVRPSRAVPGAGSHRLSVEAGGAPSPGSPCPCRPISARLGGRSVPCPGGSTWPAGPTGSGRTGHCSPERPSQPDEPHYGHPATA